MDLILSYHQSYYYYYYLNIKIDVDHIENQD